jgi:hypothetical protein
MSTEFPLADDQLFRLDLPDWKNSAIINWGTGKFPFYAEGYKEGAKALIVESLSKQGMNDILVYPIVYLYRQYVELRLKEVIMTTRYCNGDQKDFPAIHNISQLWAELKKEYVELGESATSDDFENANRVINEFSKIDPMSVAFRYPVDKEGNDSLKLTHLNIRNFGEVMDRLARFLDAISDHAAHYEDLTDGMNRDNNFN